MDPILNPFTPGAGIPPRVWVGRDAELEQAAIVLGRLRTGNPERSMILTGLRGVGKTVLLGRIRRLAETQGWLVASFEGRADVDLRGELQAIGTRFLERVDPMVKLEAGLGELRAWLPRLSVSGVELEFGATAPEARLEADVVGLIERLGAAAKNANAGVALFVDEMQDVPPAALAALCAAMHRAAQEVTPIALFGAGLPVLPGVLAAAKSYAERLFTYPQVGRLADEQSKSAIRTVLASIALTDGQQPMVEEVALEELVGFAEGYPMFLQSIGKHAWAVATAPVITAADVQAAGPRALAELATDLFTSRWQRATRRQRRYIAALAEAGGHAASGAVAEAAGFAGTAAASPIREELIARGIVYPPERGFVAFTVPKFDRFVRDYLSAGGE